MNRARHTILGKVQTKKRLCKGSDDCLLPSIITVAGTVFVPPSILPLFSAQYELRFAVWRPETAADEAENGGVSATFFRHALTPFTHDYEADSFHYTKNPLKSKYMEVIFGQDELTESG